VYKVFILNALEALFIAKLGLFSAWTIFTHQDTSNPVKSQLVAAYFFTAITLAIFLTIIFCHTYHSFWELQIMRKFQHYRHGPRPQQAVDQQITCSDNSTVGTQLPSITYIDFTELRESLLTGSDNC